MEPQIRKRDAFVVLGMKYRGRNEHNEIPGLWDVFMPRSHEVLAKANEHVAYGVIGNYDEATGEYDYVAGFEVGSTDHIPEGMVSWVVPAQTYAVFATTLPGLHEAFTQAYEWLAQSGYRHADGPTLEYYGETFDPSLEMDIYIPVTQ